MVNGRTWPFLTVERRRYRFRFLNGCQSRFLDPRLRRHPGGRCLAINEVEWVLAAPGNLTPTTGTAS